MKPNVVKILVIGFVLLSIVIGLIIASYDPLEVAKKEQDEKLQSSAGEFLQANVQYYAEHGGLPWFEGEDSGVNCFETMTQLQTIPMTELQDCAKVLADGTTLPRDFLSTPYAKLLFVTNPNPQTGNKLDTVVCFQPQSKELQRDPATRYNQDGTDAPANRCVSQGGQEDCYWCTQ